MSVEISGRGIRQINLTGRGARGVRGTDGLNGVVTNIDGAIVFSNAALVAIPSPVSGETARVVADGCISDFIAQPYTLLAAEVALDPNGIIYKRSTADTSIVWVRNYQPGFINIRWAGVVADGVTDPSTGLTTGTDDTLAAQAAVDWIYAHGGGTILLPIGIMVIGGVLRDTSFANAQVVLPANLDIKKIRTVKFLGLVPPALSGGITSGVSMFKSTLTSGTGAIFGCKANGPGNISYVNIVFQNVVIRQRQNPQINGVDLRYTHVHSLDYVRIDVEGGLDTSGATALLTLSEPTKDPLLTQGYGYLGSLNDIPIVNRVTNILVFGYVVGIQSGELTDGDNIIVSGCKYAFRFPQLRHPSRYGRVSVLSCCNMFWASGNNEVYVQMLDIEHSPNMTGSPWIVYDTDILDPESRFRGKITWHMHDLANTFKVSPGGARGVKLEHYYSTAENAATPFTPVFPGLPALVSATSIREIIGNTVTELPWHSLIARQSATFGELGAISWSNFPPGYSGSDYRNAQVSAATGSTTDSGIIALGTSKNGVLINRLIFDENGVAFLRNATAPAVNPSGGGYFFSEAGALKWRGSSGTVTTIAPA